MRRILLGVGLVSGALLLAWTEARACGDKFLVIGRGVRYQRAHGAVQRASIVMYLDPKGHLEAVLKESRLEANLKLAGHTLRSVADRSELGEILRSERYDILLADISEMVNLEGEVQSAARPFFLPVIYNPSGEELAEAERQYSCVMKSPSTKRHYLAVIDDAIVQKQKARAAERR